VSERRSREELLVEVKARSARRRQRRRRLGAGLAFAVVLGVAVPAIVTMHGHRASKVQVAGGTTVPAGRRGPQPTAPPIVVGGAYGSLYPMTMSTWWAVVDRPGGRSYVVRTTDSGRRWQDVTPPVARSGSVLIDANYDSGGYSGGYFFTATAALVETYPRSESNQLVPAATLYRTNDGGATWQAVGSLASGCQFAFADQSHGWCTVHPGLNSEPLGASFYRTSDGGTTWQNVGNEGFGATCGEVPQFPFGCGGPQYVTFTTPRDGWATSQKNLYSTTDDGTTWHPIIATGPYDPQIDFLGPPVISGSRLAIAERIGPSPSDSTVKVLTSSDGGATWSTHIVPGQPAEWSADLIDQTNWAFTDGTHLMTTDDAGQTWTTQTPNTPMRDSRGNTLILNFETPQLGWAWNEHGPVAWTTDAGATWHQIHIHVGNYRLGQ
jgi:hypothetical protein